ncbi:SEC10/PgrA surface exclusion domain-containing protein [Globicatella sanguinis]|uniref:SEC10/PgrA surface exclusion domain-containing protein n=1 Tax=Globicatella sanguinis TaxID=13076 RepID=UPI002542FA6A|nr:SEC10/PgrA surface exclusion domain-containing protein [Globicatella sanguinis]MDK7631011.1 SEC10/PgrA surface exclusion domain-containing protein [Globicatella sanguinis]WIK67028.1 SEC10/PgrA surface exclusion domain-containing protein [Globicatella sanguinis]WKT56433.1 SEC10/PgrA surface exclusion domain-containing protein [Globicatella sanguinis]
MNRGLKLLRKVKGVWVAVAMLSGFMGAGQIVSAEETVPEPTAILEENNIDEDLPAFVESEVIVESVTEENEAEVVEISEAPVAEDTTEASSVEETTETSIEDTTEAVAEETTEASSVDETTEASIEDTTEAPVNDTTESSAENTTEETTEDTTEETKEKTIEEQIADLDEKIKEKEAECQTCEIQMAELKDEITRKESEIAELEATIKQIEQQQVIDEAHLTELKECLANVEQIRAELVAKQSELTTEMAKTASDLDAKKEERALSEEQRKQAEADKEKTAEKLAAADKEVADKQAALDRLTSEGVATEIKALENEKAKLGQEIESLSQQIADLRAQSAQNADTAAMDARINELTVALDEWKRVADALQAQKDQLLAQKSDLDDKINQYRELLGTPPVVGENRILIPAEFTMENIYKLYTGEMTGAEFDAITKPYSQLEGSKNQFVMNPGDKERIVPDINDVSEQLIQELTFYSLDLINQIRQAVGVSPLVANHSTIKFADDIAKRYVNDAYTYAQSRLDIENGKSTAGHYDKAISEEAGKNGLDDTYGNFYENLGWGYMEYEGQKTETGGGELTEDGYVNVPVSNIKRAIYSSVLNMMFDDGGEPNYGHLYSLIGLSEYMAYKEFEALNGDYKVTDPEWYNKQLTNIANDAKGHFGFSMGNVKEDNYYQTRHHFITVTKPQVRDEKLFDLNADFTLDSVTQQNEEVEQLLNETLAQFEKVNMELSQNENNIQANNAHGAEVKAEQDALAEEKTQKEELAATQSVQADQLVTTQTTKEERLVEVNTLLESLSEENANLAQAIAKAQEVLEKAKSNKELQESNLIAINDFIEHINTKIADLTTTIKELEASYTLITTQLADVDTEIKALAGLPVLIEQQQKTLHTHATHLATLSKQLNDKEAEFTPLKEALTALEKNCEEVANNLAELKEKRKQLVASIKSKETDKEQKGTQTSVKKSAVLPETGEKDHNVLPAVAILLTTGLGFITLSKRKEDA